MKTNPLKAALFLSGIRYTEHLRRAIMKQNEWASKLPKHGAEGEVIGLKYIVTPQSGVPGKARPHRIKVLCPCGLFIPLGRIVQHVCDAPVPDEYTVAMMNRSSDFNITNRSGGQCFANGCMYEQRFN